MCVASKLMTGRCYPYIYQIGCSDYDSSWSWQYSHKRKISADELRTYVRGALIRVLEVCAGDHKHGGFTKDLMVQKGGPGFSSLMMHPEFHEHLKRQGFIPVEITEEFHIRGDLSFFDVEERNRQDPDERKLCEKLEAYCNEKGIYVEEFLVERKREELDRLEKRLRGEPNPMDEEGIQETLRKYRTYHRLSRRETEKDDGRFEA